VNSLKSTASSIAICLTLLGPASFGLLASARAAEPAKRPNILYIMTDDHAAHAMSCYGSKVNKTPNLDRIAEQGVRFDSCFVTTRSARRRGQHPTASTANNGVPGSTASTLGPTSQILQVRLTPRSKCTGTPHGF